MADTTEAVERLEAWADDLDRSAEIALRKPDLASTAPRVATYRSRAADLRALLSERTALLERVERAERERDAWKRTAEHHFGHMRAALDLAYAIRWPADPEFLDLIADQIDCGGECETSWREWDTNATGCTKSDSEDGCPFEHACRLRDFAQGMRVHAWTLAFSPPNEAPNARAQAAEAKVATLTEALSSVLPWAEIGRFLWEERSICYGDGYTQPYERTIEWDWQQSTPSCSAWKAMRGDVDAWIAFFGDDGGDPNGAPFSDARQALAAQTQEEKTNG